MELIDWRFTFIRLSAVAISLGTWAGIVLVVAPISGVTGRQVGAQPGAGRRSVGHR